jgi:iron complex transport system substrate-binding protein
MKSNKKHNKKNNNLRNSKNYCTSILLFILITLIIWLTGASVCGPGEGSNPLHKTRGEFIAVSKITQNTSSTDDKNAKAFLNAPAGPGAMAGKLNGKLSSDEIIRTSKGGLSKFQSYHANNKSKQNAAENGSGKNTNENAGHGFVSAANPYLLSSAKKITIDKYSPLKSSLYYGVAGKSNNLSKLKKDLNLADISDISYNSLAEELKALLSQKSSENSLANKFEKSIKNQLKKTVSAPLMKPGQNPEDKVFEQPAESGETLLQSLTSSSRQRRPSAPPKSRSKTEFPLLVEEPKEEEAEEEPAGPKIISLAPNITEILFALGMGHDVIGVSDFCDYPSQVFSIPQMGNSFSINTNMVLSLKPDVVFVIKGENIKNAIIQLRQEEIKVVELQDPVNLPQITRNVSIIAKEINADPSHLNSAIRSGFAQARSKSANHPKVFIDIGGFYTASDRSFIGFLLNEAGAKNTFGNLNGDYGQVSWESVVKANPDIIIALSNFSGDFSKMPKAKRVKAVKENKVYYPTENEINIINRSGPRSPTAVRILNRYIHKGPALS